MKRMFASYIILTALAPASLFAQGGNPPAGTRTPGRPVAATPAPPVAALAQGPAGPTTVIRPETIKAVYMTVTGAKQGTTPFGKGKIRLVKYQLQLTSPRDLATGTTTGRLSLAPISITKAWDAASAPLLQAFDTNETLSVTFEFVATADVREQAAFTIKLTNASITMFSQSADAVGPGALEDVHFSYQKLDFDDNVDRVSASISTRL